MRRAESKRIRSALEVAEHLRAVFTSSDWLKKHQHMKINEMVVFYIDKNEKDPSYPRFEWPTVDPKYSTLKDISKNYCFKMCGRGRVASRRFCCFCPACCAAHEDGLTATLDIADCKRRHLSCFKGSEQQITCTAPAGLANAKARAKALWSELKPLLKAGKLAAVQVCPLAARAAHAARATATEVARRPAQARELWSKDEKKHLRPGHFWACELGDADGKGSPILHIFTQKSEYFELSNGEKVRVASATLSPLMARALYALSSPLAAAQVRGDAGECLLLLRRYYHRTADDAQGLTFKRWEAKKGEILVLNSSELRAVQGHQKNHFILNPINPPNQRAQKSRAAKGAKAQEVVYPAKQKWALDPEVDLDTRRVCEAS